MGSSFSCNLVHNALYYNDLLARVRADTELIVAGPVLTLAITRYTNYMKKRASPDGKSFSVDLPVDVAWVWCVHALSPAVYREDCLKAFGKVIPFHHDERRRAPKRLQSRYHEPSYSIETNQEVASMLHKPVFKPSIDLTAAVLRQVSFLKNAEPFAKYISIIMCFFSKFFFFSFSPPGPSPSSLCAFLSSTSNSCISCASTARCTPSSPPWGSTSCGMPT
eukprot:TRINITY_DN1610_c0_g1_i1.p1 TRINITY_DN1610_c0_g1~~TRINITY_DN1610_c0_g1_i1.p1  ORF type:complete len:221 (+),score=35.22 TRINITY_DN1610_c0_g1_i1:63-725(+)